MRWKELKEDYMSLFAALLMRNFGENPSQDIDFVACGVDASSGKSLTELGKWLLKELYPPL